MVEAGRVARIAVVSAVVAAVGLLAGCGQAIAPGAGSPTESATTQRASADRATARRTATSSAAHSDPAVLIRPAVSSTTPWPRSTSAFVMLRVTRTVVVDENVYFAPPAVGAVPRISASTAFATARQAWGDPRGTATPEVVLTSMTNDGQGQMLPDGGIRRFDVNRFVWAVVDTGASCSSAGPAEPGQQRTFDDCVFISFVDARTGQARGSMDGGGPGVTAPQFGPDVTAGPSSTAPATSAPPRRGTDDDR